MAEFDVVDAYKAKQKEDMGQIVGASQVTKKCTL